MNNVEYHFSEKGIQPKISIITITYNSEKTIEETIQSILDQHDPTLEYIIIDGGSTDHTLNIIQKYNEKISIVVSEPDQGIADAFNKGIQRASGDIIGIINSDDLLAENAINVIKEYYTNDPQHDVYYGDCIIFHDKGHNHVYRVNNRLDVFQYRMAVCHPSTFVRAEAYRKWGGFNTRYRNAMDYELLSRMYYNGASFQYIPKTLAWFRTGGASDEREKITRKESAEIAIRNGMKPILAYSYYFWIGVKRRMLSFIKKTGTEQFLRRRIKRQVKG